MKCHFNNLTDLTHFQYRLLPRFMSPLMFAGVDAEAHPVQSIVMREL